MVSSSGVLKETLYRERLSTRELLDINFLVPQKFSRSDKRLKLKNKHNTTATIHKFIIFKSSKSSL